MVSITALSYVIDDVRVSDVIDEISVRGCKLEFGLP